MVLICGLVGLGLVCVVALGGGRWPVIGELVLPAVGSVLAGP